MTKQLKSKFTSLKQVELDPIKVVAHPINVIKVEAAYFFEGEIDGLKYQIYYVASKNDLIPIGRRDQYGCVRLVTDGHGAWATSSGILHSQLRRAVEQTGRDLSKFYNTMCFIEPKGDGYAITDIEIRYPDGEAEKTIKHFFNI